MDSPQGLLGNAIKKARIDKKLTQEKLAELVGITSAHMKQLESERRKPSLDVLYKLVYALDLSLDSLFSNPNDITQELKHRINLCLDRCNVHELQVAYATIEALLNKEKKAEQE